MPALNRVQLIGRLGKDPESHLTPNGKKVTTFTVAVNRRWKSNGETREAVDWFNVETWGRAAEHCEQYLAKGKLVFVEGRLQTDRYEQNGEVKYYTKVVAQQMQILERRQEEPEIVQEIEEETAEYEV